MVACTAPSDTMKIDSDWANYQDSTQPTLSLFFYVCGASLIVSIVNSRSKARALAVGYTVFFFFLRVMSWINNWMGGFICLGICWIVSGFCEKNCHSVYIAPVCPSTTTLRGIWGKKSQKYCNRQKTKALTIYK